MSENLAVEHPGTICFSIAVNDGYPPRIGGLAVAAHRISHYLADAGFDVHVLTYGVGQTTTTSTREGGLTVHRVVGEPGFFEQAFAVHQFMRKLDDEVKFDLFHGFFLFSVPTCMAVARTLQNGKRRPLIASIRGSDATMCMNIPQIRPQMLAALRDKHCWVTCVNQTYLDSVGTEIDIAGRTSLIRNGAPVLERQWRLDEGNVSVVGSSGEFRKVKDIPLLVRAFCGMRPELRRKLLLVGAFTDPLEENWSQTLLREAGLMDAVEVTGFMPHAEAVAQLMRMNVYVQSSAFEGLPNALLEAAATGVPIVATAVGGVKEIFTDGYDALLVPHADHVALTRAIERVIEDRELALRLAENASKLCARFSWELERDAWVELHRRLIAGESVS